MTLNVQFLRGKDNISYLQERQRQARFSEATTPRFFPSEQHALEKSKALAMLIEL